MKKPNQFVGIVLVIVSFYGVNYICFLLLPKWLDLIIGLPLSLYVVYRILLTYVK